MLAFCRGDPTLRTSHIELRLNIVSPTLLCWCTWWFHMCFELSSHPKDFWLKSVDYPFHIGLQIRLTAIYIYMYCKYMLALCCGDPTLRTSHVEPRLNIDSTTLLCWCAWEFQMCFQLSSHLKDLWVKSVDYPFHIEFKIRLTVIYIYAGILLWRPHT